MKKLLIIMVVLLLVSPLYAEDSIFKSLQMSQVGLSLADVEITRVGLKRGAVEVNPFVKWYIESPTLTVAVNISASLLITWGTSKLYKKNKTLGIISIIAVNLVRGYVIYHNIRELSGR